MRERLKLPNSEGIGLSIFFAASFLSSQPSQAFIQPFISTFLNLSFFGYNVEALTLTC